MNFCDSGSGTFRERAFEGLVLDNSKEVPIVIKIPRVVSNQSCSVAFGFQSKNISSAQLESYSGIEISKVSIIGDFEHSSKCQWVKTLSEAKCQANRFRNRSKSFYKEFCSYDLSNLIETDNKWNKADDVVQADILVTTLPASEFDRGFSQRVLPHFADPIMAATLELRKNVPPGNFSWQISSISKWSNYFAMFPLYGFFLKEMNPKISLKTIDQIANGLLLLLRSYGHSNTVVFEQHGYIFYIQTRFFCSHNPLTASLKRIVKKPELIKILHSMPNLAKFEIKKGNNSWIFKFEKRHG